MNLALVTAILIFVWVNPRLFPAPKRTDTWGARGVLGERVWPRRREMIPEREQREMNVLTAPSPACAVLWIAGLGTLALWAVTTGALGMVVFKLWFVDRCVVLWEGFQREGGTLSDLDQ